MDLKYESSKFKWLTGPVLQYWWLTILGTSQIYKATSSEKYCCHCYFQALVAVCLQIKLLVHLYEIGLFYYCRPQSNGNLLYIIWHQCKNKKVCIQTEYNINVRSLWDDFILVYFIHTLHCSNVSITTIILECQYLQMLHFMF